MERIMAYDEMGNFEKKSQGICFLGGFSGEVSEYKVFVKELEDELQQLCNDFNKSLLRSAGYEVVYPASLHMSADCFFEKDRANKYSVVKFLKNDKISQAQKRTLVSRAEKCICDFMEKKNLRMFCFVDPYIGEYRLANLSSSNVGDLSRGANLYEYMLEQSIFDQLFYSIGGIGDKVFLEVATRIVENQGGDLENLYDTFLGNSRSSVTNTSTIKTAIFTKLREGIPFDADIVLNVRSANYGNTSAVLQDNKKPTTPCLYAADIICAFIRWKLQEKFGLNKDSVCNTITSKGLLEIAQEHNIEFRINDDCDDLFNRMVTSVRNCEVQKYYESMHELLTSNSIYTEFYEKYWMAKLDRHMQEELQKIEYRNKFWSKIPEYITCIERMMRSDDIQYEKGLFIAKKMSQLLKEMDDYASQEATLFHLYDIILSGLNHRGETEGVITYIDKCAMLISRVGGEEIISHSLRVIQYYFNTFEYQKALDAGLAMVEPVNELKKAYIKCARYSVNLSKSISGNSNDVSKIKLPLAGKVFSSVGQAYAFMNQYSNAKRYFLKALDEFEKGSGNERITMGHLLHLYIEKGKRNAYELQANQYFGSNNLSAQLKKVLIHKGNAFPLFVYVKAFNKFYAKDIAYKELLKKVVGEIENYNGKEHPWELIYSNVYQAIMKSGLVAEEYSFLRDRAANCIECASTTIRIIQIGNQYLCNGKKDISLFNQEDMMLIKKCIHGDVENMDVPELCHELEKILTYMYR